MGSVLPCQVKSLLFLSSRFYSFRSSSIPYLVPFLIILICISIIWTFRNERSL